MTDAQKQSLALAFLERFWADRDAEIDKSLADYLAQFPGDEETIAGEYLSAVTEARGEGEAEDALDSDDTIGPYRLLSELGRGGQGIVWLAEDTRLNRKVALKVLTGMGPGAEGKLARFKQEAELASKLDHPGICSVHDTGIERGIPYIAMRYVDGETLGERLSRLRSETTIDEPSLFLSFDDKDGTTSTADSSTTDSSTTDSSTTDSSTTDSSTTDSSTSIDRPELDRTIAAFEKIATALHAAHELGIVHRDIKPGNIMLTKSNEPVLLDFGLAHDDSDSAGPSLTQTGDLFGTPAYMSPEQITGRRVKLDRRSDVYSLGVTLYECLTMKRPFEAPTRESLYQAIMSKEAQPVRKLNRMIPSDLEVVLQCAMDKDRDKRYQTAADLAEDLRRIRKTEPILAKKVSFMGRAWRWSKRRPAAAALLCVLALGTPIISGLGVWYWDHRDEVRDQEQAALDQAVEDALEVGFFEAHHGDKDKAIAAFEEALSLNGASAEAAVGLALTYLKLESPKSALEVIERAEQSLIEPGVLASTKADILDALDRKAQAIAVRAAAPAPRGALMWFLEGQRAMAEGKGSWDRGEGNLERESFAEAEALFKRSVQSSSRARRFYHFQLAYAAVRSESSERNIIADAIEALWPDSYIGRFYVGIAADDPERRIRSFREAIRIRPDREVAHFNLGVILAKEGRYEEAIAALDEAIRLDPGSVGAHDTLGTIFARQGKVNNAVAAFDRAIDIDPNSAISLMGLGKLQCDQLHQYEAAEASFRAALEIQPRNSKTHHDLSISLLKQGKSKEALDYARKGIRLDPKDAGLHLLVGDALHNLGNLDGAIAAYDRAIAADPDFIEALIHRSAAFIRLRQLNDAIKDLDRVIAMKPNHPQAHTKRGIVLFQQGRHRDAINAANRALGIAPGLSDAHAIRGQVLHTEGKLADAMKAYRKAIEINPDAESSHYNLGAILGNSRDFDEAIRHLREVTRLNPGNAIAHHLLGWNFRQLGKLKEADTAYRQANQLDPKDERSLSRLARLHLHLGNLGEAIRFKGMEYEIKRQRSADKTGSTGVWLQQAILNKTQRLHVRGKFDEADALIGEFIKTYPDLEQLPKRLEILRAKKPTIDEFIKAFEVTLDGDTKKSRASLQGRLNEIIALSSLSWLLIHPGGDASIRDPERALTLSQEAAGLTERLNPDVLNTLAMALIATGKVADAIATQEELLKLMDGEDRADIKIADAKSDLERYRQALKTEKQD